MFDASVLKVILGAGELTTKIAKLTGLIESIEGKLDLLLETPLNAGLHMLDDARESGSERDRNTLLEAARTKFYEAAQLEKSNPHRQVLSLIALASCHAWLDGEKTANCEKALDKALRIDPLSKSFFLPRHPINTKERASKLRSCLIFGFIVALLSAAYATSATRVARNGGAIVIIIAVISALVSSILVARSTPNAREALRVDIDVRKAAKLQLFVAIFLQKPVPWLRSAQIETEDTALKDL